MVSTIAPMPQPKKKPGESRRETTEPVRIDKRLMAKIRLIAGAKGMTAPEWIEGKLSPVADKELDSVSDRVKELKRPAD